MKLGKRRTSGRDAKNDRCRDDVAAALRYGVHITLCVCLLFLIVPGVKTSTKRQRGVKKKKK